MNQKTLLLSFFFFSFNLFAQITVNTVTDPFPASGGVKVGPDHNVYIGNYGDALPNANGSQIWVYEPSTGILSEFANGLQGASGNAFDSQGNFFQSNIAGSYISKVTQEGFVSTFTSVGISSPVGIAIDEEDNLYVCNCGNNTIRKVTPKAVSTQFSSGSLFACPNGITLDGSGNLYVSNFNNGNVIKINAGGYPSLFATIPGGNNGHLTYSSMLSFI